MRDVIVIGGGIIGLATAYELLGRNPEIDIAVLEKEPRVAFHQSGRNSGVIHSGIYYAPGSRKAASCRRGVGGLLAFCDRHGIPYELCGKIVLASSTEEIPALDRLYQRGLANGVPGLEKIGPERIRDIEPHAGGVAGIYSPTTGIVSFRAVAEKCAELLAAAGRSVLTSARVTGISSGAGGACRVRTTVGTLEARRVVNCGGVFSDRLAESAGARPPARIVPFRGEYYTLRPERRHLVKSLIYPVPDLRFPFLGAHFTRRIGGEVEAGPNAVLALAREGYRKLDVSAADLRDLLSYPGFWRLVQRYGREGIAELYRSLVKPAFVRALQKLVPEVASEDLLPGGSGVRAQAVDPAGKLVDDFLVIRKENVVHVLNAPSPAATSAFAIAGQIADLVLME